jgi:glycosyltransferase involved in cell wall biosynthesis
VGASVYSSGPNKLKSHPKVLVAHPGTQHAFYLARQLNRHGLLFRLWTCFAIAENSLAGRLCKILPSVFKKKVSNRVIAGILADKIKTTPWIEWIARLRFDGRKSNEERFYHRNRIFQEAISDHDIMSCDLVVGFDTSSWILAKRCKKLGKKFILDVSIGHPLAKEKIYKELQNRYVLWGSDSAPKKQYLIDVECNEIACSDYIVVPSNFVWATYIENGISSDKIKINQFGTTVFDFIAKPKVVGKEDKIRFLFFGSFTARKGLPLLLAVWSELDTTHAELILAGYGKIPSKVKLPANVTNRGAIARVQRQSLFDNAHVFVFPSNFEGLAQVQIEAAACGLPLIATFNSGGSELIKNNENGFLIEAEENEALKKAIEYFMHHPDRIEKMGEISRLISERFSWDAYGDRWREIILASDIA